jgi:hypothetical protein
MLKGGKGREDAGRVRIRELERHGRAAEGGKKQKLSPGDHILALLVWISNGGRLAGVPAGLEREMAPLAACGGWPGKRKRSGRRTRVVFWLSLVILGWLEWKDGKEIRSLTTYIDKESSQQKGYFERLPSPSLDEVLLVAKAVTPANGTQRSVRYYLASRGRATSAPK